MKNSGSNGILEFALIYDEINQLLLVNVLRARVSGCTGDDCVSDTLNAFHIYILYISNICTWYIYYILRNTNLGFRRTPSPPYSVLSNIWTAPIFLNQSWQCWLTLICFWLTRVNILVILVIDSRISISLFFCRVSEDLM